MKMIAGAASLASLEQVAHARGADADDRPRRTRDAEIEKNGTLASPATARASSVLPVPGGPLSSTPRGIRAPRRAYCSGCEEVDDLEELVLGLVDAGDVGEGHALLGVLAAARARARRARRARRPGWRAAHAARSAGRRTGASGRSSAGSCSSGSRPWSGGLALSTTLCSSSELGELVGVGEGRDLRLEVPTSLSLPCGL